MSAQSQTGEQAVIEAGKAAWSDARTAGGLARGWPVGLGIVLLLLAAIMGGAALAGAQAPLSWVLVAAAAVAAVAGAGVLMRHQLLPGAGEAALLAEMVRQSPEGRMITDRAGEVVFANHACQTLFGFVPGALSDLQEHLADREDGPRVLQSLHATALSGDEAEGELALRAAGVGYDALVLTIDNQLLGRRERDIRNGFTIPPTFGPAAMAEMTLRMPWLWRMRGALGRITFGNYLRDGQTNSLQDLAARMASLLDPSMTWSDVANLRQDWRGPLILKGVLHPDEAKTAIDHGVDGIIVSNHGGRQLDGAPATVDALPAIAEAVDGRIPVLLDGGVRRGADVVKALALGARACLIGRPQLWGLAVAGQAGVAHVLEIYRSEIDRVMGLCGVTNLADIGPDLLFCRRPA